MRQPPLIAALAAIFGALWRWLFRRGPNGWSAAFIASPEFLRTHEWARARYDALRANDGRCELCGRSKHDGVTLNVDHIISRRQRPDLALDVQNLQVLCGDRRDGAGEGCNKGKGNRHSDDWRHPSHPHRP
ncbi:HNH endonuclease (plasmid) [Skermanella rosea]|uniref:HNH endonuclease signature motif containing protein n=1 Tax=Skermanella rosea TaxID=1817965 RepID=UPI0019326E15|nr:HNH endonuclease signature motif containing protein [Skermanella rosea]UEM08037.1 HNH endonuclease [Skermanella rosea]